MEIQTKLIRLEEMEVLREPLNKLHEYHNQKSEYFSGSYPRTTFEERLEAYKKKAETGQYRIEMLVTSENDCVLGFCIAFSNGINGKIEVLFVDENMRGKGLGSRLMKNAMSWFEESHIEEIELTVVYGNEAVSFYEKLGFYPRSIIMSTKSINLQ